jgi:hypothetical protein
MSRTKPGETEFLCGCRHADRTWIPSAAHPQLGMCDPHKAEWQALHDSAAVEHFTKTALSLPGRPVQS